MSFERTESSLEQACRNLAIEQDYLFLKIYQAKGWPDRLLVHPKGGYVFVEFKKEGAKPADLQDHILKELRRKGHAATWINTLPQFKALLSLLDSLHQAGTLTPIKHEALTGSATVLQPFSYPQG